MNIGELKKLIQDLPDDMDVVKEEVSYDEYYSTSEVYDVCVENIETFDKEGPHIILTPTGKVKKVKTKYGMPRYLKKVCVIR